MFDCILYEMFFIEELKSSLNTQEVTPFELSFLLDFISRVNSITSCFIFISVYIQVSLLDNDLSEDETSLFYQV